MSRKKKVVARTMKVVVAPVRKNDSIVDNIIYEII
tara:strand:+ start:413 stop:517 length:105 start_codon:yes stop_codon:yes gene_type:complete